MKKRVSGYAASMILAVLIFWPTPPPAAAAECGGGPDPCSSRPGGRTKDGDLIIEVDPGGWREDLDWLMETVQELVALAKKQPGYLFNDPAVSEVTIFGDESGVQAIVDLEENGSRLTVERRSHTAGGDDRR